MKRTKLLAVLVGLAVVAVLFQDAFGRSRMYHPSLGRFMQRDVLGYVDGMSLYQYAGGNPIVATDPMGGCTDPKTGKEVETFAPGITVNERSKSKCGGAYFSVAWTIPPTKSQRFGMIVQKVEWKLDVKNKAGESLLNKDMEALNAGPYWEAWNFETSGKVIPVVVGERLNWRTSVDTTPSNDQFITRDYGEDSKGTVTVKGEAKAAPWYTSEKLGFTGPGVPAAGMLYSTWNKPAMWDRAFPASTIHTMTVTWDCCAKPQKTTDVKWDP